MAIIKRFTSYQNLSNYQVLVNDTTPISDYFRITEFNETFTGGKNAFLIEGSPFLKETTEIKIEILDVDGNPVYYEPGDGIPEYYEGLSKVVAVHIYPDTPIGLGKITILGELKQYVDENGILRDVPDEWKGAYNVKWEKNFQINRNLQNETIVRFYRRPQVNITEIVKPIFNKTIPTKIVSGSVSGEPIQPGTGTNISTWRAGTLYRLTLSSGSWDKDIDENPINISVNGNSFNPTIIEVLNDRQVLVDIPYSENSLVQPFTSQSFTASFLDFENEIPGESSLTGSFAKIDLTQLKTFAGDVARVKIYRRSRNEVGDFQFVQESRLESTELLRDIFVSDAVEIPYGNFSNDVLTTYWESSSIAHPITVDSSVLSQAVKVDYNGNGLQTLSTSQPFNISKDVEYELSFKTLLSGSTTSDKYLRAYLTGSFVNSNSQVSQFEQNFVFISGSGVFTTRQNVSQNILAERDVTASLAFDFKGDDWYLSQVSLKNAQETSFSPDEFTLVQSIPRKLEKETFDFRFEFYDINNNYIPVDITATKEFDGGNDYVIGGTSAKILTFESDRNAFRYASGSASPNNQTILLQVTKTNLTGSILYESSAFDQGGNFLTSSGWSQYPGLLTNRTDSVSGGSSTLTVANFSGSWTGSGTHPEVYSIVYTASVEDLLEYETVFRVEDGDNAPQLLVTSNANQFIYEPTSLSPKPSGQSITVRAQRKNLESLNSTITVTSGSNLPPLTVVSDTGGIKTYSISSLEFSSSFAQNNFDEVTYNFSSPDVFGVNQTDQITISKVINFDGISLVLSNESVTFPANSTGDVIGGFDTSSGSVQMFIGGNQIQHDDASGGRLKNTFDITSVVGSGVTPTSASPTNQYYSISGMSVDSGSLTLNIEYLAGDSSTSQSFQKVVTYTKAKKAAPNIEFQLTPTSQTIEANSLGSGSATPQPLTVTAREGDSSKTVSITNPPTSITNGLAGNSSSNIFTFSSDASDMTSDTGNVTLAVSAVNSEGVTVNCSVSSTVSRVRKAPPSVTVFANPQSQTISSGSNTYQSPSSITILVKEGSTTYSAGTYTTPTEFDITSVSSGFEATGNLISTTLTEVSQSISGSANIRYTNSEGTTDTQSVDFSIGVAVQGVDGEPGPSGSNGDPGQRVATGLVYYQLSSATAPPTPSATSYTFADNTFTGLTTNWEFGAPTFEAGNSQKYWYSRYSVTETTAGGGTGVPSFSTSTQAIGFTGLVTFTSDNQITDGDYILTNIPSGSITNHIGGPNVTTIEGGKISTGQITSTGYATTDPDDGQYMLAGTIFNLDNGSLRSKNFYIDSSGNANFRGNIAAGSFVPLSTVDGAGDLAALDDITLSLVTDAGDLAGLNSVSSTYIDNDAITEAKIAINAVTSGKISANAVVADKIAANAIVADKIAAGAIVAGKIAANAVTANTIVANAITTDKLATNAIKSGNFASGSNLPFSDAGSFLNLANGDFVTPNFAINSTGGYFSGNLSAGTIMSDGTITGGTITGTNFIGATGEFSGNISADTGTIGGWTIQNNEIYVENQLHLNANRPAIEVKDGTTTVRVDINSNNTLSSLGSGTAITSTPTDTVSDADTISGTTTAVSTPSINADTAIINYAGTFANVSSTYSTGDVLTFSHTGQKLAAAAIAKLDMSLTHTGTAGTSYFQGGNITVTTLVELRSGVLGTVLATLTDTNTISNANLSTTTSTSGTFYPTLDTTPKSTTFVYGGQTNLRLYIRTIATRTFSVYQSSGGSSYSATMTVYTPEYDCSLTKEISKTEIAAGGLQVVRDQNNYVKMDRVNVGDPMLQVGGDITATGNITANASDIRLKENIVNIQNPLEKINKLNGVYFNWNSIANELAGYDTGSINIGLIAQEVEEVLPEATTLSPLDKGDGNLYKTIWYEKLVALLVEGMKELNKKVDRLEEENKKLKDGN